MVFHPQKKLIVICAAIALGVASTIALLVGVPTYVMKYELEQALGDKFRAERISFGWGSVEVYAPRFLKDGQTAAYAKRIILKVDFLALLKPGFSISSAVLDEPFLQLEVDRTGEWEVPIIIPLALPGRVDVKQIAVKNGTLIFQDHRLLDSNRITAQKIDARLDDVSIPFKNAPSTFAFQTELSGELISGLLSTSGTFNFGTLGITIKFEGQQLALLETRPAGPASRVERMSFTATSEGISTNPLIFSDLVLTQPYARLERDRNGNMTGPLMSVIPKKTRQEKGHGTLGQIEARNCKITRGELLILDGEHGKQPFPVRITDIALDADFLEFTPGGRNTTYHFSGRIPGTMSTGVLASSGKINLKTFDTIGKVSLSDLDLTALRPYLVKPGAVDVSRGFLDLRMDLSIKQNALSSPGHAVIKDLAFVSGSGLKDDFLSIPRSRIVKALESNNHRIEFDFILEGSLENPEFNFQGSPSERIAFGLAKSLGLPVLDAGETVTIQGGRAIRDIGRELQNLFK